MMKKQGCRLGERLLEPLLVCPSKRAHANPLGHVIRGLHAFHGPLYVCVKSSGKLFMTSAFKSSHFPFQVSLPRGKLARPHVKDNTKLRMGRLGTRRKRLCVS